MNPLKQRELTRLRTAMDFSQRKFAPFRGHRMDAIRQLVGNHYSDDGASDKVPINLLELATNIYLRRLISGDVRTLMTSDYPQVKLSAQKLGLRTNEVLQEIHFSKTAKAAALDAMFSMAIIKVGISPEGTVEVGGVFHDALQSYADIIDLDDWVHDVGAKRYEQVAFAGHKYRLPYDYVMQNKTLFWNTKGLMPTFRGDADEQGEEKVESVSRGSEDREEARDYIELWDIWLPLEELMLTMPLLTGPPLRVWKWEGPERGPFHLLNFADVPGQIIGLAPSLVWRDLHDLVNRLYRKLGRQAERQKTIAGYSASATGDAERIKKTSDGDMIRMDDPKATQQFKFGGVDGPNFAFAIHLIDKFSWFSGNLDSMGGLSAMSETVGQDAMMNQAASRRLEEMASRFFGFLGGVCEDVAFYIHSDPTTEIPLVMHIPGTDIAEPIVYTADERENDFFQHNIKLDVHALQRQSPMSRLNILGQVFQTYIAPYMEQMMQQGIRVNFEGLLKTISRYTDMSELEDILDFSAPTMPQVGPSSHEPRQAAFTRRENVRINRPAGTRTGKDAAMMQTLLGAGVQNAEMSALAR